MTEQFWIEQWDELNRTRSSQNGWATAAVWDAKAESYGGCGEKWLAERRKMVASLLHRGIITPQSRILDIGCGPGSFGVPFAEVGCEVVAVDISPKMIERFEREIPVEYRDQITCRVCNWHDMNPDAEGFTGAFDLVFANMTPAISTHEDLARLMACSRKWCHFAGWSGVRRDFLMEELRSHLSIGYEGAFEGNGLYVFNWLAAQGFHPETAFRTRNGGSGVVSVETMVTEATAILGSQSDMTTGELRTAVATFLGEKAVDGMVSRQMEGTSLAMQWSV